MGSDNTVLFVCSHNSARSQMAEGWLQHLAGDRFEVASAGIEPGTLNPLAVRVMAEVGIDISGHEPEGLPQDLDRRSIRFMIVVCDQAAQSCPRPLPNTAERLAWFFDDPSAARGSDDERLAVFRRVRDEIRDRITGWLASPSGDSPRTATTRTASP